MKIMHVAPPFLPLDLKMQYGGIERVILSLVRQQQNLGVNVGVIAPSDSNSNNLFPTVKSIGVDDIYKPSIDKLTVRQNSLRKIMHVAKVLEFALQDADSVFHLHDDYLAPFMKMFNRPCLLTLHSPYEEFWMAEDYPDMPRLTVNLVAISQKQREIFEHHGYEVQSMVYNGIEVEDFPYSTRKDDFLLSLSAIARHKGQHTAINVAKQSGMSLVIAGNIADKDYFSRTIQPQVEFDISSEDDKLYAYRTLPNRAKIVYAGSVNDAQKKPLYAYAKAFLMPIDWDEPFGLVAIEALAGGTPVIASKNGALPEIVRTDENGFLCTTESDMIAAVNRLSKLSYEVCRRDVEERFSAKKMAMEYLNLYERLNDE